MQSVTQGAHGLARFKDVVWLRNQDQSQSIKMCLPRLTRCCACRILSAYEAVVPPAVLGFLQLSKSVKTFPLDYCFDPHSSEATSKAGTARTPHTCLLHPSVALNNIRLIADLFAFWLTVWSQKECSANVLYMDKVSFQVWQRWGFLTGEIHSNALLCVNRKNTHRKKKKTWDIWCRGRLEKGGSEDWHQTSTSQGGLQPPETGRFREGVLIEVSGERVCGPTNTVTSEFWLPGLWEYRGQFIYARSLWSFVTATPEG